jgi:regulatory protein
MKVGTFLKAGFMIKDILPISADKKRKQIIFDNGETLAMLSSAIEAFQISKDTKLTNEKICEYAEFAEEKLAFEKAVDAIGRSMKSQKEMRLYLRDKGFKWTVCESTVEKLVKYGYIDDKTYTEAYLNHYGKSYGRQKLLYELTNVKCVDREIAEAEVAKIFSDEVESEKAERILEVYLKKQKKKDGLKPKAYAHLRSKGFSDEIILRILDKLISREF